MAILTPLPLSEARRIGALYGLDVASARGLLAGSVNSNFELTLADGGRVFLRVYEEQTAATAAGEARLLKHLAAHGVETPRPLAQEGGSAFISEHAGKPVALFPWIDGEVLCQERVTPEAARRVGRALARVHLAGASFNGAPTSRFGPDELKARLLSIDRAKLTSELARDVDDLLPRLDQRPAKAPTTSGIIHGDLFRDNVLFRDGEVVALLDFESASRGSAAFDLGVTLLAWCYKDALDRDLARALAQGYSEARPLPDDDRGALFDETRFAAVRFAITRITDYELRPRGSSGYRDYRRFLARLSEIEHMGEEGLLTGLGL